MSTHANRVKMTVSGTPGTGTITLGSASSGYQSLASAYGANATVDVVITDGTAWEVARNCTYTHSGTTLTRGTLEASSTGSAISLTSSAVVSVTAVASKGTWLESLFKSMTPGGRLTLESGVSVSTTDQTARTTVYFTPYVHNIINLWDGSDWVPTTFTETSLALGTITSGKNYDVFGYSSVGTLTLEMLAWTSDTARATAVTLQDGRYCKSGDKTRLLLGTFRTTATTTTEDSLTKRFLCNVYNRVARRLFKTESTDSWAYNSNTCRQANASSANQVEIVASLTDHALTLAMFAGGASSGANYFSASIGEDSTTAYSTDAINYQGGGVASVLTPLAASLTKLPAVGYHYYAWLERSNGSGISTTFYSTNSGVRQGGLSGSILA
jgi:hypothetical protein